MITAELVLRGDVTAAGFPDWICHRARLLDLSGWVSAAGDDGIRIVVSGPEALVDAMEMACSLGPRDVLVTRIERHPFTPPSAPNGFHRR